MDCSGKEVCAIVLLLYMIMSWTNINLFTGVEEVEEVGEVKEVLVNVPMGTSSI